MPTLSFSQLFAPNQVDNAAPETLYTCPSGTLTRNMRVRFTNTTAGAVTIEAWAVPTAGSAGDTNACYPQVSIGAESYVDVDIPILTSGDKLQAQAGAASSITAICLDGFEQT